METNLSQDSYLRFTHFLHSKLGIVLGENRQYLVRSRLSVLARNRNYASIDTLLHDVISTKDALLTEQCLELMTTNETFWFRDEYPFYLLKTQVLPQLSQQNRIRIWSSACASGQETYSIAMTVLEYQRNNPAAFAAGVEIIGTDFSSNMVNLATAGIYNELALSRGLPNNFRQNYFADESNNQMQINARVKSMTKFKRINLLHDYSSLGRFDIVFCRNVLIYFDGKQKTDILKKIAACLPVNGSLFLGAAESINGAEQIFKMQNMDKGLYYTKL